jgi:plasmid stabilization system protein ParE
MGYEVRLTAKARGDLREIVAYIAQDNPLAAERLGDELAVEADSLSNCGAAINEGSTLRDSKSTRN